MCQCTSGFLLCTARYAQTLELPLNPPCALAMLFDHRLYLPACTAFTFAHVLPLLLPTHMQILLGEQHAAGAHAQRGVCVRLRVPG